MSKRCLISAAVLLLWGGSAWAQTIKVNWRTGAPFSSFHTYAWRPSKNEGAHFYRQWVMKDVDAEMAQKGLREVTQDQHPDLYVYYHVASQEVLDSETTGDGIDWGGGPWGYWGGWGGWGAWGGIGPDMSQTETEPRMMGILSVDLVDAKHKDLAWRGQATVDSISDSQKGDEKQVLKSVEKMFKQYPPKKKKG